MEESKAIKPLTNLPNHVAIVMDGNGRWATHQKQPRLAGHKAGVETLKKIVESASDLGIKYLTVYAFSTENWKRPTKEVNGLLKLLLLYLRSEIKGLHKNNVRLNIIGAYEIDRPNIVKEIKQGLELTENNTGLTLTIAFNYGGQDEIIRATKLMVEDVLSHKIDSEDISKELFSKKLYTYAMPDPDLMIRTGGEVRISNFLLWQIAYSELYFTDVLWPDFDESEFKKAISSYQSRKRRYGAL